jgi:hypothetical protein
MSVVGAVESGFPAGGDFLDAAVEYISRGEEGNSRVVVNVIIPGEELLAPASCVNERGEALRIVGLVLERLELGLGEGVVVADVRPAEAALDAEGAKKLGEPLRPHRRATVGMHCEGTGLDTVSSHRLGEQLLRELGAFALGEQPTHGHPTEQVEDDIQVVEDTRQWPTQLGDIPCPDLVWRGGLEGRFGMLHRATLSASLTGLAEQREQPIHRADGREVDAARQQSGVHLPGRLIHELLGVQNVEHGLPFGVAEATRARGAREAGRRLRGLRLPVERGATEAERAARLRDGDLRVTEVFDSVHQLSPSVARLMPRMADTFFWRSMSFSASESFASSRAARFSSSAMRRSLASSFGLRPGLRPARASLPWSASCLRHAARWEL